MGEVEFKLRSSRPTGSFYLSVIRDKNKLIQSWMPNWEAVYLVRVKSVLSCKLSVKTVHQRYLPWSHWPSRRSSSVSAFSIHTENRNVYVIFDSCPFIPPHPISHFKIQQLFPIPIISALGLSFAVDHCDRGSGLPAPTPVRPKPHSCTTVSKTYFKYKFIHVLSFLETLLDLRPL